MERIATNYPSVSDFACGGAAQRPPISVFAQIAHLMDLGKSNGTHELQEVAERAFFQHGRHEVMCFQLYKRALILGFIAHIAILVAGND